ncbi:MAG TPA: hypothetical protein VGN44_18625 [Candidatus Angelobacter sp.]|jgi:hypothetical protein
MSKIKLFLLLVFFFAATAFAQPKFDPQEGPKPIAMTASSSNLFGAFAPFLAVYDDGQIICQQSNREKGWFYAQKQLSSEEFAEVKKNLAAFGDWSHTPRLYRNPNCFDCSTSIIYLKTENQFMAIRASGLIALKPKSEPDTNDKDSAEQTYLQRAIKLEQYLLSLRFTRTEPWEPHFFKVTFLEAWLPRKKGFNVNLLHWPKNWPGLESPNTDHDIALYSIYLPGTKFSQLRDLAGRPNQSVSIEIDGKAGTAKYRYVLPNEQDWNKALNNKEEIP